MIYEHLESVYRNKCVLCLSAADHPHHIIPKSAGGDNSADNVVSLCAGCHEKVHTEGAKKWEMKIRRAAALVAEFYWEESSGPKFTY